jgi:hypothetical protein
MYFVMQVICRMAFGSTTKTHPMNQRMLQHRARHVAKFPDAFAFGSAERDLQSTSCLRPNRHGPER